MPGDARRADADDAGPLPWPEQPRQQRQHAAICATGFIGRRLVPDRRRSAPRSCAMTRRPESYDGPGTAVGADVMDADSLLRLRGCQRRHLPRATSSTTPTSARQGRRRRATSAPRQPPPTSSKSSMRGGRRRGPRPLPTPALAARGRGPARHRRHTGHRAARRDRRPRRHPRELTRQLVKNLPAMVVPKWVGTRTQPISIHDVVRYLAGSGPSARRRRWTGSSRSAARRR